MRNDVRIVHNKVLGGWFIVRGPHQTPLGGRFESKAAAQAHLDRTRERLQRIGMSKPAANNILGTFKSVTFTSDFEEE
jgi:hypothetical protein